MRVAWLHIVVGLVGCGRLGFDTPRDGALGDDDGSGGDGAVTDAVTDAPPNNPDAMDMVVTFGESSTAMVNGVTRDTYISQEDANANFGGADDVRIERDKGDRALVALTLTAIPTSATILSARLRLFVEVSTDGATISFHRVNEQWDEGNDDGTMGVANYTFRTGLVPWSVLGAYPPSIGAAVLGTFPGTALGNVDVDLPVSLVQTWVSDPGENHGILMQSDNDSTVRFVSSEGTDGMRPLLTVTYE